MSTSAAGEPAPPPQSPSQVDWSRAALDEIEFAYKALRENHPGVLDPANPGISSRLLSARSEGRDLARRARSAAGFRAAVDRFNTVIGDGHAGAVDTLDEHSPPRTQWPGFLAVWRGEGLFVYASEPGGPRAGAQVLGCDGMAVRPLLRAKVFRFIGRASEPGNWWTRSVNLFVDQGNPFVSRPNRCRFKTATGTETRTLLWSPVDADYSAWRKAAYNGDVQPVGQSEPVPGVVWIALPTFQPDASQRDAYRKVFSSIRSDRTKVLKARAVVIDLRGNQGGSSEWSADLAAALWGAGRVDRAMAAYFKGVEVWWRASKDNAEYVAGLVNMLRDQGQTRSADELTPVVAGLEKARAQGDAWFVEPADAPSQINGEDEGPALTTPVYVIVPGQCASACLDALDTFTRFPNTRLIGAPSSADSAYIEVRTQAAPPGRSVVIIPNKMWVRRPRPAGASYAPRIEVRTLTWSAADFLAAIEADLSSRAPSPAAGTAARSATRRLD